MGHADVQTTMKYMHHRSRAGEARLLSAAFRPTKKVRARTKAGADGAVRGRPQPIRRTVVRSGPRPAHVGDPRDQAPIAFLALSV